MFFNTERYFDVTKYVRAIKDAVDKAKSSCGEFSESMNKLRSELGWSAVASGAGVALSGVSTGLGIYNLKKTEEVASSLRKQESLQNDMDGAIKGNEYYWIDNKVYLYQDGKKQTEGSESDCKCDDGLEPVVITTTTPKKCRCRIKDLSQWQKTHGLGEVNASVQSQESLKAEAQNDYKCWKPITEDGGNTESACTCTWDSNSKSCTPKSSDGSDCKCEYSISESSEGFRNFAGYKENDGVMGKCEDATEGTNDYDSKECREYRNKVAVWKSLSDGQKKCFALPTLCQKAEEEKKNYLDLGGRAGALNELSASYKSAGDKIVWDAGVSHTLDVAQATLSGVSTLASGVTVFLSVSAIGEVDKALSSLKTCKTDMANLSAIYNEYMAEVYDEYQEFLKARDENSGVAYDYDY